MLYVNPDFGQCHRIGSFCRGRGFITSNSHAQNGYHFLADVLVLYQWFVSYVMNVVCISGPYNVADMHIVVDPLLSVSAAHQVCSC